MKQQLMRHHWLALHDLLKCLGGKFIEVVETYSDALSSWNNKGHIVMACAY